MPGSCFGRDPVAMITDPASTVTGSPDRRSDSKASRPVQTPPSIDDGDLVLAEQELHALVELAHDRVPAAAGDRVVEVHVAGRDAERLRVMQLVEERGALQQCLGRDAAAVEARAAYLVLLHQHDAEAELGRTDGRRVAAHSAPENGDVNSFGHRL